MAIGGLVPAGGQHSRCGERLRRTPSANGRRAAPWNASYRPSKRGSASRSRARKNSAYFGGGRTLHFLSTHETTAWLQQSPAFSHASPMPAQPCDVLSTHTLSTQKPEQHSKFALHSML